jgi:hypothetical protein
MELYSAYLRREEARKREEENVDMARAMLVDKDFQDRLYLFMFDLSKLPLGYGLDCLPYYGLYFNDKETKQLARCSSFCDDRATPQDILLSLEQVFPCILTQKDGIWKVKDDRYLHWIRTEKICVPGTITGVQAKEILQIHLEEEARERQREKEEQEKEDHAAQLRKKAAERRRETREKKKQETATSEPEADKSESDGISDPAPPPVSSRQSDQSRIIKPRDM